MTVHPRGFGFLAIERAAGAAADDLPVDAFIPPPELESFLDGDRVEASVEREADGRASARGLRLLERARAELFGEVVGRGRGRRLRVDAEVANADWKLAGKGADDVAIGAHVVARIDGDRVVDPVVIDPAEAGLVGVLVRHGVRREFPAALTKAARKARPADAPRRDLRELPTVTIDSASTRDIDDALAVLPPQPDGAVRVIVSIADVDASIEEGGPLDLEARERGTSVYLPDLTVPMLPPELSEGSLSLLPGVDRAALSVELRIDPEGGVTAVDVAESRVRSHARLTYVQVAEFLDEGREDAVPEGVRQTLMWLRTAASRLSAVRAARGGLAVVREEARLTFDASTREPTAIDTRKETSAHRLVERLMVACNEAVAVWLTERGLPAFYRVHEEPDADRIERLTRFARSFGFETAFGARITPRALAAFEAQFEGTAVEPSIRAVTLMTLGPARYDPTPGGHFGLAAPLYLHFTSPIRRYADLAVHRIVRAHLRGRRDQMAGDPRHAALAAHLNVRGRAAQKAERERLRMLAARLFASRTGERFDGRIISARPFGLVVQLQGAGVTGTIATDALPGGKWEVDEATESLVSGSRRFTVGQAVRVEVTGADEARGRIELALR